MAADGTIKILVELVREEAQKALSAFGKAAEKVFSGMITTAKLSAEAVALVGAGLTAAGGAAVKIGADFESAMSRVQAISGAVGEDFEALRDQAIDLGASTAFSAREAAEGMENLASAGFEVAEIMDAMPGMLDLAASSGESLATASDIAASTLRAFNMEASEAAHVADVLAQNAAATNAGVYDTGEAMKYVAPVAYAMGIAFEECAAAIGILANNGIKGSQAGTTLRGAMSRIAKPTGDMKAVMEELGISFYNSEGRMKSLTEQVAILKEATAGLSNEVRDSYLITLYGQEALSGMTALLNTGDEKLKNLTASYQECDGAAQAMAETMQDNLTSRVEQMQGALESLGITIFYELAEPLKEAAEEGTEAIERVQEAFTNGGLQAAVQEAGNAFADLASSVAKKAPDMVKASVEMIQAFGKGISKNKKEILQAAKEIVSTFVKGIADLLPRKIGQPIKEAMEEMGKSIQGGGLKSAVEAFTQFLSNMAEIVGTITEKTLPVFVKVLDVTAEHAQLLAAAIVAIVTAYKGFTVVSTVTSILTAAKTAFMTASAAVAAYNAAVLAAAASGQVCTATLTLGQAAVGLLTKKITLATAAQTVWNTVMNANPIGLVIAAVAALAAGIAVYHLATENVITVEEMQTRKLEEMGEKLDKQKTKWQELEQTKAEQIKADMTLMDYTGELWNELKKLTDENGKVKEGYEERASFIVGRLNESLGMEIEMTDGVIQKYNELSQSIDAALEKKKAQILLDASEAKYSTALQNVREAEISQAEAKRALDEQQLAVDEAKMAYQQELARIEKEMADSGAMHITQKEREIVAAQAALAEEERILAERQQLYNEADAMVSTYYSSISEYETLAAAISSGNSAQMQAAITAVTGSYQTATTATATELATQLNNQKTHIALLKEELDKGAKGITADKIANAEADLALMQAEYDKATSNLDAHTKETAKLLDNMTEDMSEAQAQQLGTWLAMVADAQLNGKAISSETSAMVDEVISRLDEMPPQAREVMKNAMDPMLEEMQNSEPSLFARASSIANGILSRLRRAFDIHSPSRETRKIFRNVMEGAELGLSDEEDKLYLQSEGIAGNILKRFQEVDISTMMRKVEDNLSFAMESFLPSAVKEKIVLTQGAGVEGGSYDPESGIDYEQLGKAVCKALQGIKVEIDGYSAGEILTPYTDKNLGREEKWRERQ